MAETTQIFFEYKELLTMMIKEQGIHEGRWQLLVNFGFGASNAGPSDNELMPAALVAVAKIGLQRAEAASNLSVDAAEVNPAPRTPPKKRKPHKS